jgi:hypothetical protein
MLPAAPFPRTQGHRRKQADNRGEQRSLLVDPASSLTGQFVTFTRSFAVALKNRRPRERRQPWCPRRHDEVMPSTPPRGQFIGSVGFLTNAWWHGWHAAAASGRFSIGPLMQLAERDLSRGGHPARRPPLPRRCAMTSSFVTKLAVTLALALTTAATVSFAQSRPQSCIPHYDASGAQEAPYC